MDHASLNQIVESVESRLDEVAKEKGVTFDYADYYANAQADQTNLNQIGADLVADGVDVIVAVATPTAATMLAAVEDTDIPVVYSAVTDPAAAGFDTEPNITGTSDALNTDAIMPGADPGAGGEDPVYRCAGAATEGAPHQLEPAEPGGRTHRFCRHRAGRGNARRGVLFHPQLRGEARR